MALQWSRGGESEEVGGSRAGIGRIRFTFLSWDVISRQGQSKANTVGKALKVVGPFESVIFLVFQSSWPKKIFFLSLQFEVTYSIT